VGTPREGKPSGVRKLISPSRLEALRASEVSVRTTPFTCGCQASVAINIRMSEPEWLMESEVNDSLVPTFVHRYFRRMTSSICKSLFPAVSAIFRVT
jgi:hypothetical protein